MMTTGHVSYLSSSSKALVRSFTLSKNITIPAPFKAIPIKTKNTDILAKPINFIRALITSSVVSYFGSSYISIFFILKSRK